jgi:transcriptional regulator with XRE-family HTH domain
MDLTMFDLRALKAALDVRRTTLGLSWTEIATELGISVSTLRSLGTRPVAEGDGVLRLAAWLGRTLESFVPGQNAETEWTQLPGAAGSLRFDSRKLYAALDAERVQRGVTWREIADACEVGSLSALTRLRDGGRVMFPQVMRVFAWLGAPAAEFVRVARA